MRGIIVMAMFTASLAAAAGSDYEELRELNLDVDGIASVDIDAGAGSLEISGVSGLDEIRVMATILVPGRDADKARKMIESDLVLTLERHGDAAVLKAEFDQGRRNIHGDSPSVQLVVQMPDNLDLVVDDGSGGIDVSDVEQDLIIVDDGSGGLDFSGVKGRVKKDS